MLAARPRDGFEVSRHLRWQGRSGRHYDLAAVDLGGFVLTEGALSLLARGSQLLWIGTLSEVIHDHLSRARFRLALEAADRAFDLPAPEDEVARMTLVWDIEGGALE